MQQARPLVTIENIQQAQQRIAPYVVPTRLERANDPDKLGTEVWLKLENSNITHSFKIRGALNAMLSLSDDARQRGVITASSGNHAQGIAYAAHLTGTRAQILMPPKTPQRKVDGVRRYGAEAILIGPTYDDAEREAIRRARDESLTYVSAYNDPHVIAGAGTVGLEIVTQLPAVERVLVCVGGGGLVSGVACAIKAHNPSAQVIGVCAEAAPAMYNFFYGQQLPEQDTLADALAGDIEVGSMTFDHVRRDVDQIVLVSEAQIADAMRWLVYRQGWIGEGGGVVALAALLAGFAPPSDQPTAVVISGGNVDETRLHNILCE
jgi:threonine dehydratase